MGLAIPRISAAPSAIASLPPREFRQQEAERATTQQGIAGQRGWPQDALAQLRVHPASAEARGNLARTDIDEPRTAERKHHHLPIEAHRVHWGYFSRALQPQLEINSGDTITIETLTQHASDDPELMIAGDTAAESVFGWTKARKNVDRRGAGPMDASIFRARRRRRLWRAHSHGARVGEGRPARRRAGSPDPRHRTAHKSSSETFRARVRLLGRGLVGLSLRRISFRTEAARGRDDLRNPDDTDAPHARALYSYRWEPQTDPFGVVHATYDYPGVPVLPGTVKRRHAVLDGIRIPLRPHFGVIAVAPREVDFIDSVPPSYFGGNLDNWRLGKGRPSIFRSPFPAHCYRSAIPMPRKATAN